MMNESKSSFIDGYNLRYDILLGYQLLLLFLYRIFTLFISTEGLHHIPFITQPQLLAIFTFLEIGLCIGFLYKIPSNFQNKNYFLGILLINVFFQILFVEQYFINFDPITFDINDLVFIILQVLVLVVIILLSPQKVKINLHNNNDNLNMYLAIAFILSFLSNVMSFSQDFFYLFLFLASIVFWIFLISLVIKYSKSLLQDGKMNAIIPIVVGFFLGFGMFMGMTRDQVMLAVITAIVDETFGLIIIESTIFGLNLRFLMIFIDSVLGFIFICVLIYYLVYNKTNRTETIIDMILGITGLAVFPLIAIIRFLAFFRMNAINSTIKTKVDQVLKSGKVE